MALFVYECFGSTGFDPAMVGDTITAKFCVRHIFGGAASCAVVFRQRPFDSVRTMLPDLEGMVKQIDSQREERGGQKTSG